MQDEQEESQKSDSEVSSHEDAQEPSEDPVLTVADLINCILERYLAVAYPGCERSPNANGDKWRITYSLTALGHFQPKIVEAKQCLELWKSELSKFTTLNPDLTKCDKIERNAGLLFEIDQALRTLWDELDLKKTTEFDARVDAWEQVYKPAPLSKELHEETVQSKQYEDTWNKLMEPQKRSMRKRYKLMHPMNVQTELAPIIMALQKCTEKFTKALQAFIHPKILLTLGYWQDIAQDSNDDVFLGCVKVLNHNNGESPDLLAFAKNQMTAANNGVLPETIKLIERFRGMMTKVIAAFAAAKTVPKPNTKKGKRGQQECRTPVSIPSPKKCKRGEKGSPIRID